MREKTTELGDGLLRFEPDQRRVHPDPGPRIEATGPVREVVLLQPLEELASHACRCGDLIERQAAALAVEAKPEHKECLRARTLFKDQGPVLCGPFGVVSSN
jgi:hypothetical protein